MPLLAVFWLAYGLSTVLVDPPGLTARSSTACHAPRTPAVPRKALYVRVDTAQNGLATLY